MRAAAAARTHQMDNNPNRAGCRSPELLLLAGLGALWFVRQAAGAAKRLVAFPFTALRLNGDCRKLHACEVDTTASLGHMRRMFPLPVDTVRPESE